MQVEVDDEMRLIRRHALNVRQNIVRNVLVLFIVSMRYRFISIYLMVFHASTFKC